MDDLGERLMAAERLFGGMHTNVPRRKVSPNDPRSPRALRNGGMTGGDRMAYHGYAPIYAQYLPKEPRVIVELGILRGVGLAIWCDLFPKARVIGLDVDTSHFYEHNPKLLERGAFKRQSPEVYEYDELMPGNNSRLREILNGDLVDVAIDDALHYDAAILQAMRDLMPFMRDGGVYFVEDNDAVHRQIQSSYPGRSIFTFDQMTVIQC